MKTFLSLTRQTLERTPREPGPAVQFQVVDGHLTLSAHDAQTWLEYRQPTEADSVAFALPIETLAEPAGTSAEPVQFAVDTTAVRIAWTDRKVPQVRECPRTELPDDEAFPTVEPMAAQEPRLLAALRDAEASVDRESLRYALSCVQLQGTTGQIVATDSRQALIQGGFTFPWEDDVLLPARRVLRSRVLQSAAASGPVEIGCSARHVVLRAGPWRLALPRETQRCYPLVDAVIPDPQSSTTGLCLSDRDRDVLAQLLAQRPGNDEDRSVTIDLNGSIAMRCAAQEQTPATELILADSRRTGAELALTCDRRLLQRAATLGFHQFQLFGADAPLVARDDSRTYVWMPLSGDPISASAVAQRLVSTELPATSSTSHSIKEPDMRKTARPPSPSPKPTEPTKSSERDPLEQLIAQAEATRSQLKLVQQDLQDLINGLKTQRRQSRLVQSTLDSLQKLQTLQA